MSDPADVRHRRHLSQHVAHLCQHDHAHPRMQRLLYVFQRDAAIRIQLDVFHTGPGFLRRTQKRQNAGGMLRHRAQDDIALL